MSFTSLSHQGGPGRQSEGFPIFRPGIGIRRTAGAVRTVLKGARRVIGTSQRYRIGEDEVGEELLPAVPDSPERRGSSMKRIVELAKRTPGVHLLYRSLRGWYVSYRMRTDPTRHVFTDIYRRKAWGEGDSISGPGSDAEQTRAVVEALPELFRELQVSSMLDIPCGDFHWMSTVPREGIGYVGADIVKELIDRNCREFAREGISFQRLDLLSDRLPAVDLVMCRDCLVHLSLEQIGQALQNLRRSGSRYLLTTHFPATEHNAEIEMGDWRPLNLERAPFNLPRPLRVIQEGCTLEDGRHGDKVLGLWRFDELTDR